MKLCFVRIGVLYCTLLGAGHCANPWAPRDRQQPLSSTAGAGVDIPQLGFGTWNLKKYNASKAVSVAIQSGYEHLDCAAAYGNEKQVGKGIKDGLKRTGLTRENLWITSKLWNSDHGHQNVERAVNRTLHNLGLDYLDLYLMHWPVASSADGHNVIEFLDTWRGMEALVGLGKVRYIGISNFDYYQLSLLQIEARIKPAVHQFEAHPYLQQWDFLHWHHDLGIKVTAYSPLGNLNPTYGGGGGGKNAPPSLLANKAIAAIGKKRGCTSAQVALSWGMGRGTSVIPKSQHADRIRENYESQRCVLYAEDYERIEEVGKNWTHRFNNPSKGWGLTLYEGLEDGARRDKET